MQLSQKSITLLLSTLLLLEIWTTEKTVLAAEPGVEEISKFTFSGFATLGMAYSNEEGIHAQRDWGQPDTFSSTDWSWKLDSLLGVQMNVQLVDNLTGAMQIVLRERAEQNLEESIEWAFLAWAPTRQLRLRGGRMGLDFYMLSDYRNVSFAYLWQRPPQEFYSPVFPQNVDGLDLSYRILAGDGSVTARLFAGATQRSIELLSVAGSDEIDLQPLWGGSLAYETERWQCKTGYARTTFNNNLKSLKEIGLLDGLNAAASYPGVWNEAAAYAADLETKDKEFSFFSLGAAYDDNTWLVSGEIGLLESEWSPIRDVLSAYLSIGYKVGAFTPYLLLSGAWPLEDAKTITPPAENSGFEQLYFNTHTFFNSLGIDQRTISLGLRWDIYTNVALKFQWDHTYIEASGGGLWWNKTENHTLSDTDVDLFSASINWVF